MPGRDGRRRHRAGVSGLAAARALAAGGARVVVLEARERVRGRVHTLDVGRT
ncbi:MAG: NAD(P)-binding protein, partial [Gammaproteobacteria bacterium]|nr:NAD(P)-binding protein [Gammaproteobacteria bacterium]NIR85866.1 NAD(P)-binding protein [Gammaproteobacteria bacterium]NIR88966.1 NAD(P)-binding protein [Gammaproteobacteria bacterium]NIU06527.1 NAD(P)-binding protein [Gammaproteobacteria bacterium]NIV74166.1 NAD(P)-binding protein [Gammaproteobacteria bacterium]